MAAAGFKLGLLAFIEEIRCTIEDHADLFAIDVLCGALDGKTLAFVEVRTRTVKEDAAALPELSVTRDKQRVVVRTAQRFLSERHVDECPLRFDVLAIDNRPGQPPVVRLHKDAFSPDPGRRD